MNRLFEGKVAIVTGGASWIGKEIATSFALRGANTFVIDRDEPTLLQCDQEAREQGLDNLHHCVADVSQEKSVRNAMEEILQMAGTIDILVHSSGIYPRANLGLMSLKEWQQVIDVNLTSSFLVLNGVMPVMRQYQYGRIIFISSIAGGEIGLPSFAHYTASKSGINGLMRTAALELGKDLITVNCIEPGNIFNEERFKTKQTDKMDMLDSIPVGRLGTPKDVAGLALFLSSEEAGFITGQVFIIDGGETIT